MRPICVECRVEYSCEKNEVLVNDPAVGQFSATYWYGDRWKCPGCNHQVITGRGKAINLEWVDFFEELGGADNVIPKSRRELKFENDKHLSFEFNHNLPTEKKENVT